MQYKKYYDSMLITRGIWGRVLAITGVNSFLVLSEAGGNWGRFPTTR